MPRRAAAIVPSLLLLATLVVGPGCRDETSTPAPEPAKSAAAATSAPPETAPPQPPTEAPALEKGVGDQYFAVLDLVTCEDVVLRKCRGERWRFPAGTERVWAYLTVRNPEMQDRVTVRWLRGDDVHREVRLHVGRNPRWHTWSFLDVPEDAAGWWTVEVRRADGEMMARKRLWIDAATSSESARDDSEGAERKQAR